MGIGTDAVRCNHSRKDASTDVCLGYEIGYAVADSHLLVICYGIRQLGIFLPIMSSILHSVSFQVAKIRIIFVFTKHSLAKSMKFNAIWLNNRSFLSQIDEKTRDLAKQRGKLKVES